LIISSRHKLIGCGYHKIAVTKSYCPKIAEKVVYRSVFLTIWHCSYKKRTPSLAILPTGYSAKIPHVVWKSAFSQSTSIEGYPNAPFSFATTCS